LPKQACLGGKTFSEWLAEKKTSHQTCASVNTTNRRSKSHSGKTFREWLKDKNKEKQDQAILQENLVSSELQKKAFAEEQRKLNRRVKTFEQWFEEKQAQTIIELIQSKNIPDETGLMNSKMKFPEDACLVYDMWLTSKHMEELKKDERLHEEMVETWRKKEEERLQVRRSILSKLNQAKK
jgi:AraC-like DNA-binding protein